MSLNKLMLKIRTDSGLDTFQFAQLLGITPKNLRQIECNLIQVSNPTILKLSKLLETPVEFLKLAAVDIPKVVPDKQQLLYAELYHVMYTKVFPELLDTLKVKNIKNILNVSY